MQSETLEIFIRDINSIRDYIKYINLVNNIQVDSRESDNKVLVDFSNHLYSFGVSKKLFEYKSITISLYGILEKHIGVWIKEYINELPKIVFNYNDLPKNFRDNHFKLSLKLLALLSEGKMLKYEGIEKEVVLAKLNSCVEDPVNFHLNGDAFYLSSGNLKHAKIAEALNYLDIKLTPRLKVVGKRPENFLYRESVNIENKGNELFKLIDDLVTRRNDIAHGEDIDNILNITEFNEYIDFLEGYGRAIYQIFIEKIIETEACYLYKKIENVIGIYKSGSVLCFEIDNSTIRKGDIIIIKLQDGSFDKKEILGIQRNNKSFDELVILTVENIGIDLGKGISKGQEFYIKKQ